MADLRSAAVEWVRARDMAEALRKSRAELRCEYEEPILDEPIEAGGALKKGPFLTPCWKRYVQTAPDASELIPRNQWCPNCLKRQEVHEQRSAVVRRRGALMRSLLRAARAELGLSNGENR